MFQVSLNFERRLGPIINQIIAPIIGTGSVGYFNIIPVVSHMQILAIASSIVRGTGGVSMSLLKYNINKFCLLLLVVIS